MALRYFNVFGPRQDPNSEYAAVVPRFIRSFRLGESPVIFGDGLQSRDFTYVENVVNANMDALVAPNVGGRVYNIACGDGISLNDLAASLRRTSVPRFKLNMVPSGRVTCGTRWRTSAAPGRTSVMSRP